MPWFKIDDSFAFHPKTITLPAEAGWLWVRAGAWCSQQLTDGRFPSSMVVAFNASEEDAHALVAAGLWKPTEDGYEFHDWAEYQPSRDQVLAERAASKERQKRARERARTTRHGVSNGVTDGVTHAVSSPDVTADVTPKSHRESRSPRPDPTRPVVPDGTTTTVAARSGSRIPDEFAVSDDMREWALENAPGTGVRDHEAFCDYWRSIPGAKGRKTDWVATWRNWMRRASDDRGGSVGRQGSAQGESPEERRFREERERRNAS